MAEEMMMMQETTVNEQQDEDKHIELSRGQTVGLGVAAAVGVGMAVYHGIKGVIHFSKLIKKAAAMEREGVQQTTTAKVDGQPVEAEVVEEPKKKRTTKKKTETEETEQQ